MFLTSFSFISRAHGNTDSGLGWPYEGHKYARLSCLSSYLTLPFPLLRPVSTLLFNAVLSFFSAIFLDASLSSPRNHGVYNAPTPGMWGTLLYSIFLMFVSLPAIIITYRLDSIMAVEVCR